MELRPSTLQDLGETERSLACWFNPSLGVSVCRILGVDPRQAFQREIRSERQLTSQASQTLPLVKRIELGAPAVMAQEIAGMMNSLGVVVLSGIFHVGPQRLFVGPSDLSHTEIGQRVGLWEEEAYTRIVFGFKDGLLKAVWPVVHLTEAFMARRMIERMLWELFDGVPVAA